MKKSNHQLTHNTYKYVCWPKTSMFPLMAMNATVDDKINRLYGRLNDSDQTPSYQSL